MKYVPLISLLVLAASARATTLLVDDFSGASIDPGKWSTILPSGSSSVTQGGGVLTTSGRGILATAATFSTPYTIAGSFTMLTDLEHFKIVSRTDLAGSSFFERTGILVAFSNDGNQISIQRYTSSADWSLLASASFPLNTGEAYSFSITDTGSLISLAINGVERLSASSTYATGGHVAFYSREFAGSATAIDSVSISRVPDTSSSGILLAFSMVLTLGIGRRSKRGACRLG